MATSAPLRLPKVTAWRNFRRNCRLVRVFERGRADPFPCDRRERVVDQRLLKVTFQSCYRLGSAFTPMLGPVGQSLTSLNYTLSLVDGPGLFEQLLAFFALVFAFEFAACLFGHVAQLVKQAALFEHGRAVHKAKGLP